MINFTKNNFEDGDILYAKHMNQIEEALENLTNLVSSSQSDWNNIDPEDSSFIQNKPFQLKNKTIIWDGITGPSLEGLTVLISGNDCDDARILIGSNISFMYKNNLYENKTIEYYISSQAEFEYIMSNLVPTSNEVVGLIDLGAIVGIMPNNFYLIGAFIVNENIFVELGLYATSHMIASLGGTLETPSGLYTYLTTTDQYGFFFDDIGSILSINFNTVEIDYKYKDFFANRKNKKIYTLSLDNFSNIDFSNYAVGDIIMVYTDSL